MSFLTTLFPLQSPSTLEFRNPAETFVDGTYTKTYPVDATLSISGYFWEGSQAESVVSERIRSQVDGVAVVDATEVTITINAETQITIGSRIFDIISADDVLLSGELYVIPVREAT